MRQNMYCIHCGIKLDESEQTCPLCSTVQGAYRPQNHAAKPLYPQNRAPEPSLKPNARNGALLILFFIPMLVTFLVDLQADSRLGWFFYVAGALVLGYIVLALPLWFRNPNPIVFVPCSFAAVLAYLLLVSLLTKGTWFLPFALPVTMAIGLIVTAVVVLLRCVRRGRLYIIGGAMMGMGAVMVLLEGLLARTFTIRFTGWSLYPLTVLFLLGGTLIFLAINTSAREKMERRFFF